MTAYIKYSLHHGSHVDDCVTPVIQGTTARFKTNRNNQKQKHWIRNTYAR